LELRSDGTVVPYMRYVAFVGWQNEKEKGPPNRGHDQDAGQERHTVADGGAAQETSSGPS
jgi:hypothetical protein